MRALSRRGAALMAAVIVLAVLSMTMGAVTWQIATRSRMLQHRYQALQAGWLARSGIEQAAVRLLTEAKDYKGEVIEPVADSSVRIQVELEQQEPLTYRITSRARFPTDARDPVQRVLTARFRLEVADDGRRRLRRLLEGD